MFNELDVSEWPLFTTVEQVRSKFAEGTKIIIAIGGWGDNSGFSYAASTDKSRRLFAQNVKAMLEHTGADGEYMIACVSNMADADRPRSGRRLGISWVSRSLPLRISHLAVNLIE
jgi:Glycosyl hydrolases family 18